ncbi:hypothetical protein [Brevibacterium sp. RIT 803]|uniref:hypothetical protein n=1 Tax=Brevibacterium sp. RIT 803 TaxID=2810210 RepID=UPI00195125F6|nr:hypothetical protein [Brevibacterium sp. RIT 803]MBM6588726.1 hypothetical protein [Brevibacterium sp. RIT 803]
MKYFRELKWPLLIILGLLGLVRPVARIALENSGLPTPAIALGMTVLVTLVWALALGLSRSANPLLSGGIVGVIYALGAIILSGVLSPILLGHLEGPLVQPLAIIPMLVTNAVWGVIAGGLALLVRRLRWGTWTLNRLGQ